MLWIYIYYGTPKIKWGGVIEFYVGELINGLIETILWNTWGIYNKLINKKYLSTRFYLC